LSKVIDFLKDVRIELAKVSWPTRQETVKYTLIVIGVSIAFALLLGLLDAFFQSGLQNLILQ